MNNKDTYRMDPVGLGVLVGAVFAFVVVGAIVDVLWVAVGGLIGGGIGHLVRRYAKDARRYKDAVDLREDMTKQDLYAEAQKLDIPGRASMTRDELASAIAERREA
jgi:hypothetical protein